MFATKRKRLAWGSARNQIEPIREERKLNTTHVVFNQGPLLDGWRSLQLILANRIAAIGVALNHCLRMKPCLMKTEAQATRAGKELD